MSFLLFLFISKFTFASNLDKECQNSCSMAPDHAKAPCIAICNSTRGACEDGAWSSDRKEELKKYISPADFQNVDRYLTGYSDSFVKKAITKFSDSQKAKIQCDSCSDQEEKELNFDSLYVNFPDRKSDIKEVQYFQGKKSLRFVPVSHLANEQDPGKRKELKEKIHKIFEENKKADHWVLEFAGIPERSKVFLCQLAVRTVMTPEEYLTSESEILLKLAVTNGKSFSIGDPDDNEVLRIIKNNPETKNKKPRDEKGNLFSEKDYVFFSSLQCATQRPLSDCVQEKDKKDFLSWYSRWNKKEFSPGRGLTSEIAPLDNPTLGTQKIAAYVSEIRNAFLRNTVDQSLKEKTDTVVVYGSAHLLQNMAVFDKKYGKIQLAEKHD